MKYKKEIVRAFFAECDLPEPEFEFKFHPERKWRFDLAFPGVMIRDPEDMNSWEFIAGLYIEVQGGLFVRGVGGHNRGAFIRKEHEKRNAATILGWRGLWCEPQDLCTVEFTETIRAALKVFDRVDMK